MYNPNLPQYGFGSWLKSNAGTIGAGVGALGFFGGPAVGAVTTGLGSQIGGSIQENYEQEQAAASQSEQMRLMSEKQNYQNRINAANQRFDNQNSQQNQFTGTQNFAFGGRLDGKNKHGINYNQLFPQKTPEGQDYYITRATTKTIDNPNFYPFAEGYSAFIDPNLAYEFGNTQGMRVTDDDKILFNADNLGDSSKFRKATSGKISYKDLGITQPQLNQKACGGKLGKRANGGDLNNYTGQTHSGPQGGIEVDSQGAPTVMSGEQSTALVENGEVSWNDPESGEVYIFSNRISRK